MNITINNLQKKIPITPRISQRIKTLVSKTLKLEKVKKAAEITICLVNNKLIREFNLLYLAQNSPTDVMAFNLNNKSDKDNKVIIGDILISTDAAAANAKTFKSTPLSELYLYTVHGTLHILGYRDETAKQRRIMEEKSGRILNADQ